MTIRLSICLRDNKKIIKVLLVNNDIDYDNLIIQCSKKLQTKIQEITVESGTFQIDMLRNGLMLICSPHKPNEENKDILKPLVVSLPATITIFAKTSYIHPDAVNQLKLLDKLKSVMYVAGMPDLHYGKGCPIGAVTLTKDIIYPHLIGEDIGCGMSWVQTPISSKLSSKRIGRISNEIHLDDFANEDMQNLIRNTTLCWPDNIPIINDRSSHDHKLGTIGSGNHFAELQVIDKIINIELANKLGLNDQLCYLLVHSGSRSYGESILHTYLDKVPNLQKNGLSIQDAKDYLSDQQIACNWAKRNRAAIADKFINQWNIINNISYDESIWPDNQLKCILDIWHNFLEYKEGYWIHRKGAGPSDHGPIIIPGSRGSLSYLVMPTANNNVLNGWSLAHGSGRKMARTKALETLKRKFRDHNQLKVTDLDSHIICSNKDLLYEEAPEAYKDITDIIDDLVEYGFINVIAIMKPVLTYKVNEIGKSSKF